MAPEKEEVVRRKFGDKTNVETIKVVLQLDSAAAGAPIAEGGIRQDGETLQVEQSGQIEVAADQEIHFEDRFEITAGDGKLYLWQVRGDATGQDEGSKTYVIRSVKRIRGRQPNVNTRA